MYHHLKLAEKELRLSGKKGRLVKRHNKAFKRIGFTVDYHGDVSKLVSRIVYNVKKYGVFIPNNHVYMIPKSGLQFYDAHNDITWGITIEKTRFVRYLNFLAICSQ